MRSQRMPKKSFERKKLTRHELRDLDIEIGFLEGVVKRDPRYVEALQILGDDYTRRGRYRDGLRIDEQLAHLRPGDSLVLYNLACSYSLMDDVDAALGALERALSLGYRDFKWLAEDPDLRNVRRHPLFQKIRAKLRTLQIKVR
jgi:tetratricopeptide (TPR) repeat protein